MRYDLISSRPLRPGPAVEQTQPIFEMVPEHRRMVVKGQVLPCSRPGHSGARPPAPPQPSLVLRNDLVKAEAPRIEPEVEVPKIGKQRDLTRDDLKRSLHLGTYSIISAGRNSNHPEESKLPENHPSFAKRHENLRQDLVKHGFDHTEVEGHYGGRERSFVVHHSPKAKAGNSFMVHHGSPSEFGAIRELGKKYNQDSVIHSHKGQHELHFTTGEHAGAHHKGSGHVELPHAEDMYTKVEHPKESPSKFSLNFDWGKHHSQAEAVHKSGIAVPSSSPNVKITEVKGPSTKSPAPPTPYAMKVARRERKTKELEIPHESMQTVVDQKLKALMAKAKKLEKLSGGVADGKTDKDFDPVQLEAGVGVEMEHTKDSKIAHEIARDHLAEDPHYYKKLAKMEKGSDLSKDYGYGDSKEVENLLTRKQDLPLLGVDKPKSRVERKKLRTGEVPPYQKSFEEMAEAARKAYPLGEGPKKTAGGGQVWVDKIPKGKDPPKPKQIDLGTAPMMSRPR